MGKPGLIGCLKACLVGMNVLLSVLGVVLLAIGYLIEYRTELLAGYLTPLIKELPTGGSMGSNVWTLYKTIVVSFMGGGIIAMLVAVLGCITGTCPQRLPLIAYMVILTSLIVVHVCEVAFLFSIKIDKDLKDTLRSNIVNYYTGDTSLDEMTKAWNFIFVDFECCGADSHTDFLLTYKWDRERNESGVVTTVEIPVQCCRRPGEFPVFGDPYDANCTILPTSENSYIDTNCHTELNDYLWYYGFVMIASAGGMATYEMFCVVLVLAICREMKKKYAKEMEQSLQSNEAQLKYRLQVD